MKLLFALLFISNQLFSLTLQEKIGHLLVVECYANTEQALNDSGPKEHEKFLQEAIETYHVSNVLFKQKWKIDQLKRKIKNIAHISDARCFFMLDMEWGLGMRVTNIPPLPKARELGLTGDISLINQVHGEIAQQASSTGINFVLGPVLDVDSNPCNPVIGPRSFGPNPDFISSIVPGILNEYRKWNVIACVKHFPGHGDTSTDSHSALPLVDKSREQLEACELIPFRAAVNAKVSAIMTAHIVNPSIAPNTPATLSANHIQNLLRNDLGHEELVITDDLVMKAITDLTTLQEAALQALLAGCDLIMCSRSIPEVSNYLIQAVEQGIIPESLIDEKVTRVLKWKLWVHQFNLLDYEFN